MEITVSPAKAIGLLCKTPHPIWLGFLQKFEQYAIYIIIDDNQSDYTIKYQQQYPVMHFIQLRDEECLANGFSNLNKIVLNKEVTAWDKASYYFSCIETCYQHIWLVEEDVFIYNEKVLLNIDQKFPDSDLLTAPFEIGTEANISNYWYWPKINIPFPPPYYCALVCCARISNTLLQHIKEYAVNNKQLFFLEAFFPTMAMHHHLTYHIPKDMTTVLYRFKWDYDTLNKGNTFHPVKNISFHKKARNKLQTMIQPPIKYIFPNFITRIVKRWVRLVSG